MKMRVAIIGCGAAVEDLHVPWLKKHQRNGMINIVALCDRSPHRAAALGRAFPRARICAQVEEALTSIDLALIASPAGLHFEHALAALRAGSHVLTEKPMVTRSEDAEALCSAARTARRVLAVGLPRRYFPHAAEVARIVRNGELGDRLSFKYREGAPYSWPVASAASFRRESSGGGVLMDKGAHALDTLDQVFGAGAVLSCRDDALVEGVECNAVVELTYPELGARGSFQVSWDQPLQSGLHIRGERAEIWLDLDDIRTYRRRSVGESWSFVRSSTAWPANLSPNPRMRQPAGYLECIEFEWIGMLRAVLHGEAPGSSGESAGRVIKLIEDAYRAAEPLDLPWLSDPERAHMRERHWRVS